MGDLHFGAPWVWEHTHADEYEVNYSGVEPVLQPKHFFKDHMVVGCREESQKHKFSTLTFPWQGVFSWVHFWEPWVQVVSKLHTPATDCK